MELRATLREALRGARAAPATALSFVVGVALALRVAVAQLATFGLPLYGEEGHHWRQAFTYGVAWNFVHGPIDPLRPRMWVELARSNVIAMEAPVYPLVASGLMRISGDSVVGPRLVSWLSLAALAAVALAWLGDSDRRRALGDRAGLLVALAASPMVAVEFRSIQPDPLVAGLTAGAAFFLWRYARGERRRDAIVGILLGGLSVLVKPVALGVMPALVAFAAWPGGPDERWRRSARRGLLVAAGLALALVPWLVWDRWSHQLWTIEMDRAPIIAIDHDPREMLTHMRDPRYLRTALLDGLPSYAGSWWLVPAYLAGAYRALAVRRHRAVAGPLAVWLAGYVVELLAFGDRLHSNAYYFILGVLPVAYFAALGLGAAIQTVEAVPRRPALATFRAGLVTLCLLPLGAAISRRAKWAVTHPASALGLMHNKLVWTDDLGLALLVAGVLVIPLVAARVPVRRVPRWLVVPLTGLLLGSGYNAFRDAAQYFRFYVALDRRPKDFDVELGRLRAEVARHTTPGERIVMSPGGSFREPNVVHCYYALRDCFSLTAQPTNAQLDEMRARGARLHLMIDAWETPVDHPVLPGNVVASGPWWRLSCIAPDGCARGPSAGGS